MARRHIPKTVPIDGARVHPAEMPGQHYAPELEANERVLLDRDGTGWRVDVTEIVAAGRAEGIAEMKFRLSRDGRIEAAWEGGAASGTTAAEVARAVRGWR